MDSTTLQSTIVKEEGHAHEHGDDNEVYIMLGKVLYLTGKYHFLKIMVITKIVWNCQPGFRPQAALKYIYIFFSNFVFTLNTRWNICLKKSVEALAKNMWSFPV